MDVKKRLFMIGSLLLVSLVVSLVMMEKYGFATFYEVRCEDGRVQKCQPNGSVVMLQNFVCLKKSSVSLDVGLVFNGKRRPAELMPWSMTAGRLVNQTEPSTRAFYVDGFEFWRRRLLFGWQP